MKVAIFPGSFDPITAGHEEIVRRGLKIFDKIIVAVGSNSMKKNFISHEDRIDLIKKAFSDDSRVEVVPFVGLTVDFCRKLSVFTIIRGLRTSADFEYERAIGQANRALNKDVETVFILTSTENTFISSTIVRDVYSNGGDVSGFLPEVLSVTDIDRVKNK